MAQQTTQAAGSGQIEAVARRGTDRTHFLHGRCSGGWLGHGPAMGVFQVDTGVLVFDKQGRADHAPVMLTLEGSAFRLHNFVSVAEARALAAALLLAADHAEELALFRDVDVAMAAAGVAA